jgi:hypothetical protein
VTIRTSSSSASGEVQLHHPRCFVADRGDGSLRVQGRDDEPGASLNPAEVVPLKRTLTAAFGSTELALRGGQGEAR